MRRRPNILWLVVDALRADRCGCYGYSKSTTPTLDRLAEDGARAETAIAQGGFSLPSYATMFTGLYPSEHGLFRYPARLPEELPTLAEALHADGYRTACVGGNPFFDEFFGLGRGFEVSEVCERINIVTPVGDEVGVANLRLGEWPVFLANCGLSSLGLRDKGGGMANRIAEHFISSAHGPWFCFLHYMEVHSPYWPPLTHRLAQQDRWSEALADIFYARHLLDDGLTAAGGDFPQRLRGNLYDGEVAYADALIDKLLSRLEHRGELANTIVIICADHGELLGEGGLYRHAVGFGEKLVRVPLVIWAPDYVEVGTVLEGIVELRDIPHTLAALLGVAELDPGLREPVDLLGDAPIDPERIAVSEWRERNEPHRSRNPEYEALLNARDRTARMLRHREWQYIEYQDGDRTLRPVRDDEVLAEVAPEAAPDRFEWFARRMSEIRSALHRTADAETDEDMSEHVVGRLRQLGYF